MTPFAKRCEILAELWLQYRDHEDFADFIEYNDLGLPLAYALANEIVGNTPKAQAIIDETWDLLLAAVEVQDVGFDNLTEVMGA